MTNTSRKQSGNAVVIIVIILTIILIGILGFVFWHNFIQKDVVKTPTLTTKQSPVQEVAYKTYKTDVYGIAFQYPSTWHLVNPQSFDEANNVSRSITVKTTDGQEVSFAVGIRGIGGTCDTPSNYQVLDTSTTQVQGTKPVNFSLTLAPINNGIYEAYYGLTDYYVTKGEVQTCPNTFYYLFWPTNSSYGLIEFNAKKSFNSIDEINTYVKSDEYAAIKKMITSLSY